MARIAETRHALLTGLHSPFGMALVGDRLYVANADAVVGVAARSDPAVAAEPFEALLLQPLPEPFAENLDQIAGPELI